MTDERMPAMAFPVSTFVHEELQARGWTLPELVARMGGAPEQELALDIMIECAYEPGLRLGKQMADELGRAFGISPEFFTALDDQFCRWRDHRWKAKLAAEREPRT